MSLTLLIFKHVKSPSKPYPQLQFYSPAIYFRLLFAQEMEECVWAGCMCTGKVKVVLKV